MKKICCPVCNKAYTVNYNREINKYSCCECVITFLIEDIKDTVIDKEYSKEASSFDPDDDMCHAHNVTGRVPSSTHNKVSNLAWIRNHIDSCSTDDKNS